MSKTELILSYGTFYHVTNANNVANILREGLLPNKYNDSDYSEKAPEKKAQICLTTKHKLAEHLSSFKQNNPSETFAVIEIPADFISRGDYGLDWTFGGTDAIATFPEVDSLTASIEYLGTLACFEHIPPEQLSLTEEK